MNKVRKLFNFSYNKIQKFYTEKVFRRKVYISTISLYLILQEFDKTYYRKVRGIKKMAFKHKTLMSEIKEINTFNLMFYYQVNEPLAIIQPKTIEELMNIIKLANKYNLAIVN